MNMPVARLFQARLMIGQGLRDQHIFQRGTLLADFQIGITVIAFEGMVQFGLQGILGLIGKADFLSFQLQWEFMPQFFFFQIIILGNLQSIDGKHPACYKT